MPSPFPGMDPYLEDPAFWRDFHGRMIYAISEQLLDTLPPEYDAAVDERVRLVEIPREELEQVHRDVIPDVAVVRTSSRSGAGSVGDARPSSAAVLDPVQIRVVGTRELKDRWIEIRHRPDLSLVTVIELLSPSNKASDGAAEYRSKRQAILRQRHVSLVEIDLLVRGDRLEHSEVLPPGDYYTFVSRAQKPDVRDVYGWSVRQQLPLIPIPLRPADGEARLDLDSAFAVAFQRGRYDRRLRYGDGSPEGLGEADQAWAESLAREFRTGSQKS